MSKAHQHDSLLLLEAELFVELGQTPFAGSNQVEAYDALRLHVGETLLEQLARKSPVLVSRCDGEVVDLERAAVVEQHAGAQDEAGDFAFDDTFQTIMLFAFKQFADMNGSVLHRPVVVPWLAGERRRIDGAILVQMLNGAGVYGCTLIHYFYP